MKQIIKSFTFTAENRKMLIDYTKEIEAQTGVKIGASMVVNTMVEAVLAENTPYVSIAGVIRDKIVDRKVNHIVNRKAPKLLAQIRG